MRPTCPTAPLVPTASMRHGHVGAQVGRRAHGWGAHGRVKLGARAEPVTHSGKKGERLLYIPSAGLLVTLVGLAFLTEAAPPERGLRSGVASGCAGDRVPPSGLVRRAPSTVLLSCGFVGAWLCARRVPDWSSPEALALGVAQGGKVLGKGGILQYIAACLIGGFDRPG